MTPSQLVANAVAMTGCGHTGTLRLCPDSGRSGYPARLEHRQGSSPARDAEPHRFVRGNLSPAVSLFIRPPTSSPIFGGECPLQAACQVREMAAGVPEPDHAQAAGEVDETAHSRKAPVRGHGQHLRPWRQWVPSLGSLVPVSPGNQPEGRAWAGGPALIDHSQGNRRTPGLGLGYGPASTP